jgi:hypothetical protein
MSNSLRRIERAAMPLLAALVALGGPRAFAAEDGVGVVAEYRPAAGRFNFSRAPRGEMVAVRIGTVAMAGDRLTLPAGASVKLQLAGGKVSEFNGPGDFTVADSGPLGRLAAIFQSLPKLFDDEYRVAGTAASRGSKDCGESARAEAIVVPILAPGSRVAAGERDIPLGWRGGCPPFVVAVSSGNDRLVHRESIEGWQVRLDDLPLSPGKYVVLITDATGKRFEGELEAVPAAPAIPPELRADSSNLGVTAQAVWLAGQDDGRWRLDSFELLRPLIRAGDPLAGTIGDGLLWGGGAPAAR